MAKTGNTKALVPQDEFRPSIYAYVTKPWDSAVFCDCVRDASQALVYFPRNLLQIGISDDRKHLYGIDDPDVNLVTILVYHGITRQKEPDINLIAKRLMCEGRVAGPQNGVPGKINAQLFLQLCLDIDLAQHTETFLLEGRFGPLDGLFEWKADRTHVTIFDHIAT
jgi:hypothetical protein